MKKELLGILTENPAIEEFDPKELCERCNEKPLFDGLYLHKIFQIAGFRVKVLVFWVKITLVIELRYCPKCGFLKVEIHRIF